MSEQGDPRAVQAVDRALKEAGTGGRTRRWLLERTAVGVAGVGSVVAFAPPADAAARAGGAIRELGTVAVTTEGLTVTLLSELLRRVNANPGKQPAAVQAVFEGGVRRRGRPFPLHAPALVSHHDEVLDSQRLLRGSGDAVDLTAVGNALVAGETLFVDLYLKGVTAFAHAGQSTFAGYAAEVAGCESEHRVLAQTLINATPPNDVGFEAYSIRSPKGIEQALEGVDVGFGKKGSAPGAFYSLAHPMMPSPLKISSNRPR